MPCPSCHLRWVKATTNNPTTLLDQAPLAVPPSCLEVRSRHVLYPELIAELEVLALFNLDSNQEGIKIHANASPPWSLRPSACIPSN